jgi:hypothetical protein
VRLALREEARREQRAQPPRPLLLVFVPVRRHLRLRLGLLFVRLRCAASLHNRTVDWSAQEKNYSLYEHSNMD